jgi:DNA-binding MarR family transcriptional regulator
VELHECINFLLSKSQQKIHQISKEKLKRYKITPVQYGVLHRLWEKDGQNSSELSVTLHLDGATMTGILDRLVQRSLVERKPDSRDRRVNRVFLTNEGKEIEAHIRGEMELMNQEVLADFTKKDIHHFKKMLRQIAGIK